jgi:large subunit ribosomal protein L5
MADKTDNKPAKEQKAAKEQKPAKAKEAKAGGEKRPRSGKGEGGGIVLEKTDSPKASSGKARLREHYVKSVVPALTKQFGYTNPMAVPKVQKVSLNIGLGEATGNSKLMDGAVNEMAAIAGQKPVVTKARKSIAAFKLREGMAIGCMVTLRGDRMFEFLDRLMNVALPRVRDFRGVSPKSFDGRGNYTLGLKDQLIFPEIDYNKVEKTKGMNISITTSAKTDAEGLALLRQMGMPFRQ